MLGLEKSANGNDVVNALAARLEFQRLEGMKLATQLEVQRLDAVKLKIDSERRIENLENRMRYTTQSEHDIGEVILQDTICGDLTSFDPPEGVSADVIVSVSDLGPMDVPGKGEDQQVNAPVHRILQRHISVSNTLHLCTNHSPLIDAKGREQREDLILVDGTEIEWPSVITMLAGKLDLKTSNYKFAIGQAKRRADAILSMQPWRVFAIVPIFCKEEVSFLRLDKSEMPQLPGVGKMSFLTVNGSGQQATVAIGPGFHALLCYLKQPSLLGYVKCPISLLSWGTQVDVTSSVLMYRTCSDGTLKAVFALQSDVPAVLKVCDKFNALDHEREIITLLSGIDGVVQMASSDVLHVTCALDAKVNKNLYGLHLQPRASPLVPSNASKDLFSQYAKTLYECSLLEVFHNDVSPDNLCVIETVDEKQTTYYRGLVVDWGIATGVRVPIKGFSGKLLFASERVLKFYGTRDDRFGSLLDDLESLFYVAVSMADGEVSWASEQDATKRLNARRRAAGIARRSAFIGQWEFLNTVANGFRPSLHEGANANIHDILAAFGVNHIS
jgi:hypothetical protein